MKKAFVVYASLVLAAYAFAEWHGLGFGSGRRGIIPPSVRQSPGGYRSYYLWRGGK